MTPEQRIDAVLAGRLPDRPPFGFWYHFPHDQIAGAGATRAHLDQLHRYGMDFLKVMNDNPYPHPSRIHGVEDLKSLVPLRGDEEGFGRQLELLAALKTAVGDGVYMTTTIFNAWMVLRLLVEPPTVYMPPNLDGTVDAPSRWIRDAYVQRPELLTKALQVLGQNLANFAARCVRAGADGVFLSVREDWVIVPGGRADLFDRLVRPADLLILSAAKQATFNWLHVCGRPLDLRNFADYRVAVMHWADRAAGPPMREVAPWLRPVLSGGVDNLGTLVTGTPEQVRAEVVDAVQQAGKRPIIIAPGCTFDPRRVSEANLKAIGDAARECRYGA